MACQHARGCPVFDTDPVTVEVYDDSAERVGEYRLASHRDARFQTTALAPGDYTLAPVVSPAYSDVSASIGPGDSSTTLGRDERSGHTSMTVTVGTESVDADLRVVDVALDTIFQDRFVKRVVSTAPRIWPPQGPEASRVGL